MQDALEVRVAHADLVHVIEGVADVIDAGAADADSLRHEPRPAVQVELAHVRRMRGIGDEGERADVAPRGQPHRDEARLVHAARHLAVPKPGERAAQPRCVDAVRHAPAGAAAAKAHHQAWLVPRAAVARREDAQRAMITMRSAEGLVLIVEARRPHKRAIAEHPEIAFGQLRLELAEPHVRAKL
jgi:hypothetical protein